MTADASALSSVAVADIAIRISFSPQNNCSIRHHVQAAKARGVVLGNPKLADVRDHAVASVKADTDRCEEG